MISETARDQQKTAKTAQDQKESSKKKAPTKQSGKPDEAAIEGCHRRLPQSEPGGEGFPTRLCACDTRLGVESGVDDVCADIVREAIPDRPQCFYPGVALHIIKLAHHTALVDNLLTIFEIDGG